MKVIKMKRVTTSLVMMGLWLNIAVAKQTMGEGTQESKIKYAIHLSEGAEVSVRKPIRLAPREYYTHIGTHTLEYGIIEKKLYSGHGAYTLYNVERWDLVTCYLLHASSSKSLTLGKGLPLELKAVISRKGMSGLPWKAPWEDYKGVERPKPFLDLYLQTPKGMRLVIECARVEHLKWPQGKEHLSGRRVQGTSNLLTVEMLQKLFDVTDAPGETIE